MAGALRSLVAMPSVVVVDATVIRRTVEVYETDRLDVAEAYLVARAERTGVDTVVSFDRSVDRVHSVRRASPDRSLDLTIS